MQKLGRKLRRKNEESRKTKPIDVKLANPNASFDSSMLSIIGGQFPLYELGLIKFVPSNTNGVASLDSFVFDK